MNKVNYKENVECVKILVKNPELVGKFDCLENLLCEDWVEILKAQPSLIDKCKEVKKLDKFRIYDWVSVLIAQPKLAEKCDRFEGFYEDDWSRLLKNKGEFKDMAKGYFRGRIALIMNGVDLLESSSEVEDFSRVNWGHIVKAQPKLVEKIRDYKSGWKYAIYEGLDDGSSCDCWDSNNKVWVEAFDWNNFVEDAMGFMKDYEEFFGYCTSWAELTEAHWYELLKKKSVYKGVAEKYTRGASALEELKKDKEKKKIAKKVLKTMPKPEPKVLVPLKLEDINSETSFEGQDISSMDLSACVGLKWENIAKAQDLRGVKLPKLDLSNKFISHNYTHCMDFSNCIMNAFTANSIVNCYDIKLPSIDFSDVEISANLVIKGADMSQCVGISLNQIQNKFSQWKDVFKNLNLYPESVKDLSDVSFRDWCIEDADLSMFKSLTFQHLNEAESFIRTKFPKDIDFADVNFEGKKIYLCDFSECNTLTWDKLKTFYRSSSNFRNEVEYTALPKGMDFSDISLEGEDIRGMDFSKVINLSWENIIKADRFNSIKLPDNMSFKNVSFESLDISNINFSKSKDIEWSQLIKAKSLVGVVLPEGLDMEGIPLSSLPKSIDFSQCKNLTAQSVIDAGLLEDFLKNPNRFPKSVFDFKDVKFEPYMLERPWFCDMSFCENVSPSELVKIKNLEGLTIPPLDFTGVSFEGVSIKWMDLTHCKLSPEQVLQAIDITYSQLPEMDFSNYEFDETDISGVDFQLVKGINYKEQLKNVCCETFHPFDEDADYDVEPQPPIFDLSKFTTINPDACTERVTLRNGPIMLTLSLKKIIKLLPSKKQYLKNKSE